MAKRWSVTSLVALTLLGCLVGAKVKAQGVQPPPPLWVLQNTHLPPVHPPPPPKVPQYPQHPPVPPVHPPPPPNVPQHPPVPPVHPPQPPKVPQYPYYPKVPPVHPPPPPNVPQHPQILPFPPKDPQHPHYPPPPKDPQHPHYPPPPKDPQHPHYPPPPNVPQHPPVPPFPPKDPQHPPVPPFPPKDPQHPPVPPFPPKDPQHPHYPPPPNVPVPQHPPVPPFPPKDPQYPHYPPPPKDPQYPHYPPPPNVPQHPPVPPFPPKDPQHPHYPPPPNVPQHPPVPPFPPKDPQHPHYPPPPNVPQHPPVPPFPPKDPQHPHYPPVPEVPPKVPPYPPGQQVPHLPPKVPPYPPGQQVPHLPPKVPPYPPGQQVPHLPPKVPQYPHVPHPTPNPAHQPHPPHQPTASSVPHPGGPKIPPFHTCEVAEVQRVPCGGSHITGAACNAISCCFDGHHCYFGKTVTIQCTKNAQFIVVVARDATLPKIDLDSISLLGHGHGCKFVDSNLEFAIYQFPVTACGSVVMEESGVIIYENRMTSSYEVGVGPHGAITRDSYFELLFQCRYTGLAVETVVAEVLPLHDPPLPVAALGPIHVQLRLGNGHCRTKGCNKVDAAYTSFYTQEDYPVTKVLRDPVYVEVQLIEKTDPNLVLTLGHCWITTTPNPHSLPQWDILIDGCPYKDDHYLSTLVPVHPSPHVHFPSHYKRFIFKMLTFVNHLSMEPLKQQVYIHCSTAVCTATPGHHCENACVRKKRDVEAVDQKTAEPKVVVSVGPVIMDAPKQ